MATYLLTWNPSHDASPGLDWAHERVSEFERDGWVQRSWACGNTKTIRRGDRAIFLRQGLEPRGVLAVGFVERGSYPAKHWDPSAKSDTEQRVEVRWDYFSVDPIIPRERLNEAPYNSATLDWDPRRSGIKVPNGVADDLFDEFWEAVEIEPHYFPQEVSTAEFALSEGAKRTVQVNAYERSAKARDLCISHHGRRCLACKVDMGERYGPKADGLIHVHHRVPIADIGEEYSLDPVRDLRPVCPNCHAVIHKRDPPYTIKEVQEMLN